MQIRDSAAFVTGANRGIGLVFAQELLAARAREAGTRAFKMRFSRPGTTLERFLRRPVRPSDTRDVARAVFE
jgi:hypothetical protein